MLYVLGHAVVLCEANWRRFVTLFRPVNEIESVNLVLVYNSLMTQSGIAQWLVHSRPIFPHNF